jgi:hypothetical protein
MNRKIGGLLTVLSSLVGLWAAGSPANAEFFRFNSGIGCLVFQGDPGELRIIDPCRNTPDARIEAASLAGGVHSDGSMQQGILAIHLSRQEQKNLCVSLPEVVGEIIPLPQKVKTNCSDRPTLWNILGARPDKRRFVTVHREGDHAMCLQSRKEPTTGNREVVIDTCSSPDSAQIWILEPVPAPDFLADRTAPAK